MFVAFLTLTSCRSDNELIGKNVEVPLDSGETAEPADTSEPKDTSCDPLTWYADLDADGHGDPAQATTACEQPVGSVTTADDCNDADATVWFAGTEVWYSGFDEACDGGDDYDQDADGDRASAWGGTDCDDTDPSRTGDDGCRPADPCTHPSAATLLAAAVPGGSDLTFDTNCHAYVSTIISGPDYVYEIDDVGLVGLYTGDSNYDIGAVTVDPSGQLMAGWSEPVLGIGVESGTTLPTRFTTSMATGSNWANGYLNHAPSSIAADAACVWLPAAAGAGTIGCIDGSGLLAQTFTLGGWVESVAMDHAGIPWVSVGAEVYSLDTGTGLAALGFTFDAAVRDFVFDYNDDLYAELVSGEISVLDHGTGIASPFDPGTEPLSGDGKLAITPDGWLVRLQANPVSSGTYREWELP